MQFNSYFFITIFLPIIVIGYFVCNKVHELFGRLFLIIAGACFYLYGENHAPYVFGLSIGINLLFSFFIRYLEKWKRQILFLGITANVGLIFYFKYFGFFLSNINFITGRNFETGSVMMPLAISFFTFQQIAWLVNVYQNSIARLSVMDYLLYILYFPKLISGPIVEPTLLIGQFHDRDRKCPDVDNLAAGLKVFGYGLFKKVIIADTFASCFAWGKENLMSATAMDVFIIMLAYTFEIYFDFSGYCDMGIGVSQMLNIYLPINFDSPYKAISIRGFWKRWHISLTSFLTKYIYIPLGGSRKGTIRTCVNVMIVFLISGIWHGANYAFVIWGILHGALSVLERLTKRLTDHIPVVVRWIVTFMAVNMLWLLFGLERVRQWLEAIKKMLMIRDFSVSGELIDRFSLPIFDEIIRRVETTVSFSGFRGAEMVLFFILAFVICLIPRNNYETRKMISYTGALFSGLAFVISFFSMHHEATFVYFGF